MIFPLATDNIVPNGQRRGLSGNFRDKELCGATFSPDGRWLFVNIQRPDTMVAITDPWGDGRYKLVLNERNRFQKKFTTLLPQLLAPYD